MQNLRLREKNIKGNGKTDGETRINSQEMADKIARFCEQKDAEVADVKAERKEYLPPFLYNLSTLQADANRLFKFPPKKTLDVLQKLYQSGIVSYPRSDSRHVTEGEAEMFPDILQKVSNISQYAEFFPLPYRVHPS